MKDIELKILLELKCMGVEKKDIEILPSDSEDGTVTIKFRWAYPGQDLKPYVITFINADITDPKMYSEPDSIFNEEEWVDIYYQRASKKAPEKYDQYIGKIARCVKEGGYLLTDDFTDKGVGIEPAEVLADCGLDFTARDQVCSKELEVWGKLIEKLSRFSVEGKGCEYGKIVNIRQRKRLKIARRLGLDTRPIESGLLDASFVSHDTAVRNVVNPDNEPKVAVYGGAGADVSNFLLSTNATEAYFVSLYKGISKEDLENIGRYWGKVDPNYCRDKRVKGFTINAYLQEKHEILAALAFELEAVGIDLAEVKDNVDLDGGYPRIRFKWRYGNEPEKTYSITFIDADITYPLIYPQKLIEVLEQGIDIYYQRAGNNIADGYRHSESFIYCMYAGLNPGGYFVTDDYSLNYDPEQSDINDRGPEFPVRLNEIGIPNSDEIEDGIIKVTLPNRSVLRDGDYGFVGIQRDNPELRYGWHVRVRQKPSSPESLETDPAVIRDVYRFQQAMYSEMNLDVREAFIYLAEEYPCMLKNKIVNRLLELVVSPPQLVDPGDSCSDLEVDNIFRENLTKIKNRRKLLAMLKKPPYDWFFSYFTGMKEDDVKVILELMGNPVPLGDDRYIAGILNVTKGCSIQCEWCYANPGKVQYLPWPWFVEAASKFREYGFSGPMIHYFDSDPLKDYYDPLYNKNYADVVSLLPPVMVTTAGFDIGSEGERAARRIKKEHPEISFRVSITLESAWAKKIGREKYVEAMKNVIRILEPKEINLMCSKVDEGGEPIEAKEVFREITGRDPGLELHFVNREGRGERLKIDRRAVRSDRSVHCVFGPVLNPDGTIDHLKQGRTCIVEHVRTIDYKAERERYWLRIKEILDRFLSPEDRAGSDIDELARDELGAAV